MTALTKICGLTTAEALDAALEERADFVGFVFFPRSPRVVTPDTAAALAPLAPASVGKVGLFVDDDDTRFDAVLGVVKLDLLQLHGRETPARVAEIRARTGLPVMKVISVAGPGDIDAADAYVDVADWLMFDARPPKGATRPGGNAQAFDWAILDGFDPGMEWMLSGGLDPGNVGEAVRRTRPAGVDVSSGVESAPGKKDLGRIAAFVAPPRAG